MARQQDIKVFIIRRGTQCGVCGEELEKGSMITLDREIGALCPPCPFVISFVFFVVNIKYLNHRGTQIANMELHRDNSEELHRSFSFLHRLYLNFLPTANCTMNDHK